jgi:hypothetical protein
MFLIKLRRKFHVPRISDVLVKVNKQEATYSFQKAY